MEEDRYAIIIAMAIFMAILATISVILRLICRHNTKQALQKDDYLIILALPCVFGQSACLLIAAFEGQSGTHYSIDSAEPKEVQGHKRIVRGQVFYALFILSVVAAGLIRSSILAFYNRIFRGMVFYYTSWTVFVINVLWTIGFFLEIFVIICIPISENWRPGTDYSKCGNNYMLYSSNALSALILDVIVLTLPWYPVWKLKLPIQQKIVVSGIFLLGGFVILSSIFRFIEIHKITILGADTTWQKAPSFYWTMNETAMGVVSACLPTMRPLLSKTSIDSVIRSFRSKLSISSYTSQKSSYQSQKTVPETSSNFLKQYASNHTYAETNSTLKYKLPDTYGSSPGLTFQNSAKVEAAESEHRPQPNNGIYVESKIKQ